jgi:hypothetical protein
VSLLELRRLLENADRYYELLQLHDPAKPDKPRNIVNVVGKLRRLQESFYRYVLRPRLPISPYSHGGIPGRSQKTNAAIAMQSDFVFKADVSNFYPSISQSRIYGLFVEQFRCKPSVASLCTRLCTFDHHLALGLITSPILADQIVQNCDHRIGYLCASAGMHYARFVDDITISGHFNLEKSGIPKIVSEIFEQNGLKLNSQKSTFGRLDDGIAITGIRRNQRGNPGVAHEYAEEISRILDDSENLCNGGEHNRHRPYFTRSQIRGRIQFVSWVNRGRGTRFLRRYQRIDWERVANAAHEQKLIICIKQVTRRDEPVVPQFA